MSIDVCNILRDVLLIRGMILLTLIHPSSLNMYSVHAQLPRVSLHAILAQLRPLH